jgi:peptide/nickel transport system ATP-binding protein
LLEVDALRIRLGGKGSGPLILDGVDFTIDRGETFALVGESGSGKSMTALALMGLLPSPVRAVAGRIVFEGEDLLTLTEAAMRRLRGGRVGMVFQEPMCCLNPVIRIGEQVAEAVRLHGRSPKPGVRDRVVELLKSVGIPDPERRASEYPHQLSGGMKQRIMIAMALAGHPRLLIADEPTTALDVTIQAQVLRLLKGLQRETGMAILLITHDLGVVAETADRLAVMYAGQIVESAPVPRFFHLPRHPYSRKLLESLPDSQRRKEKLAVIQGTMPPLASHFTGCRFLERCELGGEACARERPSWLALDSVSGVRCLRYGEELPQTEVTRVSRPADRERKRDTASGGAVLEVRGLKVHFPIHRGLFRRIVGHVRAVDGIDLTLRKGATLALVGESGCGKSTVGKGIAQLIRPSAGSVRLEADELTRLRGETLRRRRADLQIIFQDPMASMNPRMRVGSIIDEGMRAQGIYGKAERRKRVLELLRHVGMPAEAANRYPHEFSGGQRQRICVARALAVAPKLIVCDEPTSALDVSVQAQILNLLKDLQRTHGLSYLFISHDISVVAYLADEVAVMYLGRIVEQGRVDEILDNPAHPYTRALLSAVPVPDPLHQRQVIQLEGDMPSPTDPPSGCYFQPRCPEANEGCRTAYPENQSLSDSHWVSCWRVSGESQRV